MMVDLSAILNPAEIALLGAGEATPYGQVMAKLMARLRADVVEYRSERPGENPGNWQKDIRWLLAQEDVLMTLAALPQLARDMQAGQ